MLSISTSASLAAERPEIDPQNTGYDDGLGVIDVHDRIDSDAYQVTYPIVVDFRLLAADEQELGAWLGAQDYTAGTAKIFVDHTFVPDVPVALTDLIVAIATDSGGNSSEFGNAVLLLEQSAALLLTWGAIGLVGLGRRRRTSRP